MGRRTCLTVIAAWLVAASPSWAQSPTPTPTPTPAATPPALGQQPTPPPTGCAVTSAGLLCPQLPPGCAVTSAGLLCPSPGGVAGEEAEQSPDRPRRRPRGNVEPEATSSPPAPRPIRRLAFTGVDGLPVAVAGAALLALGLVLRRRVGA